VVGIDLYDLFVLCFVQLMLATVLVLSPARRIPNRFRWTGSRLTEVCVAVIAATALAVTSCFVASAIWGVPADGLELAAFALVGVNLVVVVLKPDCNLVGQIFYSSFLAASLAFLGYAAYIAFIATRSTAEVVTASFFLALDFAALVIWISNVSYISDVMCRSRHALPPPLVDPEYQPMVSLHIPAYNEPPAMLIKTIKAAERIDYPDFEIVVIDNNTTDSAVYGPVEEYCRGRERVKFVHVAPWPGYKSGACNLALREYTDPRAEIIGLIDADDVVQPHYLRETVGYFADPKLGFLQTFEGNRDFEGSDYYTACVDSYQGFYLSNMSTRNQRNSVPFVGTMGMFRRSALVGIGGWNEWCISEDTEASLRALKAGWSGLYVPRCFGRGVVPPSFAGLNTQRHRWCFGAMQIFRLHWRSLMPWDRSPDNHLSADQRRDYLMACLGWARDLLMVVFALVLLVITGLILSGSTFVFMPLAGQLSVLPMSLVLVATLATTWSLLQWTNISGRRALMSLMISLSGCLVTARACLEGITRRDGVFLRTSKSASGNRHRRDALRLSRWETLLALALYASAVVLAVRTNPPFILIFIVVIQATVFACAPAASFWNRSAQRVPADEYRRRFEEQRLQERTNGRRPYRRPGFTVAATVLVLLAVSVGVIVSPTKLFGGDGGHGHRTPAAVVRTANAPLSPAPATRPDAVINPGPGG
jgi:cellulose synthase/poly-beta-1,6-N-acetylglucosamine synthase-like glycosyltransferase